MYFFQLMSRCYETASTVLTSNKSFEDRGEVFGGDVMARALIDWLLHHSSSNSSVHNPTPAPAAHAALPPAGGPGLLGPSPPTACAIFAAVFAPFQTAVDTRQCMTESRERRLGLTGEREGVPYPCVPSG
jgi:hypothetical protein